jgi:hypothetical protein
VNELERLRAEIGVWREFAAYADRWSTMMEDRVRHLANALADVADIPKEERYKRRRRANAALAVLRESEDVT